MKMVYACHYAHAEQPNVITAFLPSSLSFLLLLLLFYFHPSRKLKGTETMKFAYLCSL